MLNKGKYVVVIKHDIVGRDNVTVGISFNADKD